MNRPIMQAVAILVVAFGYASVARAYDYYGTLEDAHKCQKDIAAAKASPDMWKWIDEAAKTGKGLSPECKAELDKQLPICLKDPRMRYKLSDPDIVKGDPNRVCYESC